MRNGSSILPPAPNSNSPHRPHQDLIIFVADRPGHDRRYAMDGSKIRRELGWEPAETFGTGLRKTVSWYLANRWWWEPIWSQTYRGKRLGTGSDRAAREALPSAQSTTLGH